MEMNEVVLGVFHTVGKPQIQLRVITNATGKSLEKHNGNKLVLIRNKSSVVEKNYFDSGSSNSGSNPDSERNGVTGNTLQ